MKEMFETGFVPTWLNIVLFCLSFLMGIVGIIAGAFV